MDLTSQQKELVRGILHQHVPGIEVRAFGSRVNGNAKPYSDLDMALMTQTPLPVNSLALLKEAFSESDLPFKVDIVEWGGISEAFRIVIDKNFETILNVGPDS